MLKINQKGSGERERNAAMNSKTGIKRNIIHYTEK